jgi:hypothetical protein
VDTDKWDRQFHGLLADNPAHWGSYIYTEGGEKKKYKREEHTVELEEGETAVT